MIRWYDAVLAVIVADAILSAMLWGFSATPWWGPTLAGLAAGTLWHIWDSVYCAFRARQESEQ